MARAPPTFFSITLSPLFLKSPSSLATSAPRLGLFSPGQAQSVHSPLLKAKPDHKTLDGARVWNREGSH